MFFYFYLWQPFCLSEQNHSSGLLSLMVSLMASFVLSFFPLDVLDEIWDLTESVSEGFLTYSFGKRSSKQHFYQV